MTKDNDITKAKILHKLKHGEIHPFYKACFQNDMAFTISIDDELYAIKFVVKPNEFVYYAYVQDSHDDKFELTFDELYANLVL